MSTTIVKVSSRSGKKGLKLPATIEITPSTTVHDVKVQIGAVARKDPNRMGLSDPVKKKMLKDRKALISEHSDIMAEKEILVKDLGPQISWRTVFLTEYAGPIFIHLSFLAIRPYIYSGVGPNDSLSSTQLTAMGLIVLHFVKRELETLFVHKFSANTMPAFNIFKNSGHYWGLSGFNLAYWLYAPTAIAAKPSFALSTPITYIGIALYIYGELSNLKTHLTLSGLRSRGGTERGIPTGYGFNWVTCPNYLFETIAWVGICLVSRSWSTVLFTVVAWAQMQQWAKQKERQYRTDFGDRYKKHKYVLLPVPGL